MVLRKLQWLPKLAVVAAMGLTTSMLPAATAQQEQQEQENSDRSRDQQDRDQNRNRNDQQRQNRNRGQSADEQGNRNERNAGLGVGIVEARQGLRVTRVADDSPAQKAGIREGDTIVSISGEPVESTRRFVDRVRQHNPGDQVEIKFVRDGQQQTVTASLETLREALNRNRQSQRFDQNPNDRNMAEERFYRGGPPWGGDDLLNHVNNLEQQVRMLEREIQELRSMIDDDPSRQQYDLNSNRNSQAGYSESDRTYGDRRGGERLDNDRNARWSNDSNPEERIRSRREVRSGNEDQ
ncbi:PDZ domain-containing protein [Aeoliella sp. ICT_H6.2]|uniref:PDZ domain-containing protein n=1 Tax=Aeoliella straminimaris TaxID=2954799 RepID=A0A9X2JJW2_9BACT|nr:PDZ domain-containing protein [Aeoliella straminimaris]MCO6047263.1 PDZ domain-containing protein [Aeoliella straminimaris]